jgi:hypothetical protein
MMPAMPGIHAQKHPKRKFFFVLRMVKGSLIIFGGKAFQKLVPAAVQSMQQGNGYIDGQVLHIACFCPQVFVVRLDGWRLFCVTQLEPAIRIDVAVGHVVHHLVHCPAAIAVRRVNLVFIQIVDSCLYGLWQNRMSASHSSFRPSE